MNENNSNENKPWEQNNLLSDLEPFLGDDVNAKEADNQSRQEDFTPSAPEAAPEEAGQTLESAEPGEVGGVADSLMAELQADKQAAAQAAAQMELTSPEPAAEIAKKEPEGAPSTPSASSTPSEQAPKKSRKGLFIGLGAACVVVAAGVVMAFLFMGTALSQSEKEDLYASGTYLEGVSIYDVSVGGKTKAQARDLVNKAMVSNEDRAVVTIEVKDRQIPITTKEIEADNTLEAVLNEAMLHGREGSRVQKNQLTKQTAQSGKNFTVGISGNDETLLVLSKKIAEKHNIPMKEADVSINPSGAVGEKFVYIQEEIGISIDEMDLKNKLKEYTTSENKGEVLQVAYQEAVPTTSLEALKQNMVQRSKFSTKVGGATGRRKNVAKAGQAMNGAKIMPGETYDIEGALGPRTGANGWFLAPEIVDNELVPGYGGGICQASTTLFNAALRADMEIVDRTSHTLKSSYVKVGFDAAISEGGPKMIFKNTTPYPVFIFASSNEGLSELTVEIYGAPFAFGAPQYQENTSASGGSYVSTLKILDEAGNVHSTKNWSSRYGSPKPKPTTATTQKPGAPAPPPTTGTPTLPTLPPTLPTIIP